MPKPAVVALEAGHQSAQMVAALAAGSPPTGYPDDFSVASNPADTTLSVELAYAKLSAWKTSPAKAAAEVERAVDL
jgi:hypothetical protein